MCIGDPTFFPCSTGVQQGDPLAPLLFSVGLHAVVEKLATIPELKQLWFLEDGILRGYTATVRKAFDIMRKELFAVGLFVNLSKCELYAPANVTTIHGFDCISLVVDGDGWLRRNSSRLTRRRVHVIWRQQGSGSEHSGIMVVYTNSVSFH